MALKKVDLKQNCFFVLSGLANPLGNTLAYETCRRMKAGSLALLIEKDEELLQEVKKEIEYINGDIEVMCCALPSWQEADSTFFAEVLQKALESFKEYKFKLALIMHNEGSLATKDLMEPQDMPSWHEYVQEHLLAPVALNQEFMQHPLLKDTEKTLVNITSSVPVQPMFYGSFHGSCLKARNMYFRSLDFEEARNNLIAVLTYSAGIFETHQPQTDANNNTVDLLDLKVDPKLLKLPRVDPIDSALNLINILEDIAFVSGHDVDYYDTFNL